MRTPETVRYYGADHDRAIVAQKAMAAIEE